MQRRSVTCSTLSSLVAVFALAIVAASTATAGDVTFAQYDQVNGATEQWTISTAGNITTVSATGSEYFIFSGVTGFNGPVLANFTFSATSDTLGNCADVCADGESFTQAGYSGSFAFTDEGSDPGADLLSGVFQVVGNGAQLASEIGSTGGSFDASATSSDLNQLVLSSSFLNFSNQTQEDASWSLSSLLPDFAVGTVSGGKALPATGPFDASATGTFSSNPGPTNTPEPGTFVLIGCGMVGVSLLRRRKRSSI
jgi:hypothetical protein